MKFNKIVCVDNTKLNDEALDELQKLSDDEVEVYTDYPDSNEEIIERIGEAEAVIVSWHTELDEEIIKACSNLKYIGMACSLYDDESANVAVKFARQNGITVKGTKDYGDPGVAEFIISELIQLLNGYKGKQWEEMPRELTNLKVGIIGLGVTGQLLAECLMPFEADLFYFSRTRKPDWENKGVSYLPLNDLLEHCEVISFHLPKNAKTVGEEEFKKLGSGKILINTSLGLAFEVEYFQQWIKSDGNYAIFDGDGKKELSHDILSSKNIISQDASAGWSSQTLKRLSNKVLHNLKEYCEDH
ncbi:D-isomer specific 2-hydroxyacid dehydrogenase family protein [Christiangramia forsetii]|uniref:D-isomer specific 2-hydroxyacid dehydrogenase n=2 Tax=Christiangramia forsetii TaxID=411153 RepID=A0M006_CHRFK|nr:D-isomer specific 2-hydroxyacid dehydrogenase family protein [Christiangramia forsetii]GGG45759.1 2-hydroxyacid dehydrogenase [Christiangramia forsetii]CAL65951.1 D-isomer specific 2-hydroxyacid dehydrogenase [Christiangramia forsetii KT0803]